MNTINIIDVSGFVYKAFYAISGLSFNGKDSSAVYGFCASMLKIMPLFPNSMFIAALDSSKKTFRNQIYENYKANRKKTPEVLIEQLPLIEEACEHFGFLIAKKIGFEADDIIASYAELLKNQENTKVNIISSDKDLLQLLPMHNVNIFNPTKKKYVTEDDIFEKFGVYSHNILDFLSLTGDASDNIPGVSGIGPKSAAALINQFKSLDNLIANIDQLPKNKKNSILKLEIDQALLSRKLIKLATDIPLSIEYQETKHNDLHSFFSKLGFKTLTNYIESL